MEVGTEAGIRPELVEEAARSLNPYLPPTPLQQSRALTVKAGCQVFLKIESIQPTRSFKVRGALNKLILMSAADRQAGVITASAGNHGQGVAYAAAAFGIAATVFVPENANLLKVESMKRLGARVVPAGRSYQEAYQEATRVQAVTGATLVHAFDDPQVIAGQGTVGVEIGEQLPETDTVLVPVGGGGLLAGMALYLKARRPAVRLIGVEPQGADGLTRSLAAGQQVVLDRVQTMADGLAASGPGRLNFELLKNRVDEMIRVGEDEMLRAIRLLFEWEHLLAEPSGAAPLAALLHRYRAEPDERVVLVLSGGNVTEEVMMRALRSR
ncbi:MAG: threonine/serine dehydratase [Candidatus Dormibacteraeota bacterium]|uniref:threonine ammonia-lyase n=1 Tax=Candidatus Dormiibacter inghamiae TaxID=3127013 RepID=A0A934KFC4_9BACT|nr:threonine/serine dehydratase [Candidatus Dormibacteraeota bacterium]MBJ7607050.1 threonine/serine dehydratase [Candidatus Dormibacteraeota bacterium]